MGQSFLLPPRKIAKIFQVWNYGARADGVCLYDTVYTSGSNTLSSASAFFKDSDVGKKIVLQLSQTIRQVLAISSVIDSTHILMSGNANASSSAYGYRITTYGTDNSSAIQAAITAAGNAGGGEVSFEGGIYLVTAAPSNTSTNNSIFAIPNVATSIESAISISLIGVGMPTFSFFDPTQRPGINGTIIYCTNQSVTGTDPSIIATVGTGYTGHYWNAMNVTLKIRNLTIRQPAVPKMHGVQFHRGGCLYITEVSFDLDVPYSHSGNLLADPNPGGSTAVVCPGQTSGYYSNYDRIYIYGYNTGFVHGDISMVGHMVIEMCRTGITGNSSTNMMHASHLGIYRCTTAISNPMRVQIDLVNIEIHRGGLDWCPDWTINVNGAYVIDDYNHGITGVINAHTVLANVGPIPTTVRSSPGGPAGGSYLCVFDLVTGSWQGSVKANNISVSSVFIPPAISLTTSGTGGSTSYTYVVAFCLPDGSKFLSSPATIATGNATLTSTNRINVTFPPADGCASFEVYRTASSGIPSSTGLIGNGFNPPSGVTLQDTGQAGNGIVPFDTTGTLTVKTIKVISGVNGMVGQITLVGGAKTIANRQVATGDLIYLTRFTAGGTIGDLSYTISNGVGFTISSQNALDTSVVNYFVVKPGS